MPYYGGNELHTAASAGDLRRVEQLLQSGAFDVNARTEDGWNQTALHLAAQNGKADGAVVARLIQAGADIEARDGDRRTPLLRAAAEGAVAAVEVLLAAGADMNAQISRGRVALHYAAGYAAGNLLKLNGNSIIEGGDVDIVGLLLAAGAKVDAVNKSGWTPLFDACYWSRADIVAVLLQAGAQMNKTDKNGHTPLLVAATEGRGNKAAVAATTACLISAGAELKTGLFGFSERAVTLVEAGYRKWEHLPPSCPELKTTVMFVWHHYPEDLRHLFSRLDANTQKRISSILLCLHRCLPGLEEKLRMKILQEALR